MRLLGRQAECAALDRLLTDAVAGRSGVLVLRGHAGMGKSALLAYAAERATGAHLVRAVGVESEIELAYSGLHQLCAPMLDHLGTLPVPQRMALETVFGLSEGPSADRFMVGLATLTLFAEMAEQQPLVCIVDDTQWLDQASAQTIGFVARRLLAERIALVGAARRGVGDHVFTGLPDMEVAGLRDSDARTLLLENVLGPLDAAVCEQIVKESHGNPLALLELPHTWKAVDLAGGFGLPDSRAVPGRIEESYAMRLSTMPPDTQLLLLAAAAEPSGDPALLHRAAETLGLDMAVAGPATAAGLLVGSRRAEFAHPLIRSAAYRRAGDEDRRRVHHAIAEATNGETDPDRRAWHRAQATAEPSEEVAADLERSADRAQARGGVAATAAFLQLALELTSDPERRSARALAGAQASFQAGALDAALVLVAAAQAGPLDDVQRASADLVRGRVAFAMASTDAPSLLLQAGSRAETFDLDLARETYLTAWFAAVVTGGGEGARNLGEISRAILALRRPPGARRPLDLIVEGLARVVTEGRAAGTPTLRRAATALLELTPEDDLGWGWMAAPTTFAVWDNETALTIVARQVKLVREAGALAQLPRVLSDLAWTRAWIGDFAGAASAISEAENVAAATGATFYPGSAFWIQAIRGRDPEATPITAGPGGHGRASMGSTARYANLAAAVLHNGHGRYEAASAAAQEAGSTFGTWVTLWALPELVEGASRAGHADLAGEALERLVETTRACGTNAAVGIEARCHALLTDGAAAEEHHRRAIDHLTRAQVRPDLARAHLLYGEWLRREGRRVDARVELRQAHEMLVDIGMDAFAERARRELMATGEKVRKRGVDARPELTPQEEQIARLARDGLSNPEIGAQLFISARTVEWHLRKVFTKLGITSRRGLRSALTDDGRLIGRS